MFSFSFFFIFLCPHFHRRQGDDGLWMRYFKCRWSEMCLKWPLLKLSNFKVVLPISLYNNIYSSGRSSGSSSNIYLLALFIPFRIFQPLSLLSFTTYYVLYKDALSPYVHFIIFNTVSLLDFYYYHHQHRRFLCDTRRRMNPFHV